MSAGQLRGEARLVDRATGTGRAGCRQSTRRAARARRMRHAQCDAAAPPLDLANVFRGRPAAAADQAHAAGDEAAGVRRHVFGRRRDRCCVLRCRAVCRRWAAPRAGRGDAASRSIVSSIGAGPTLQLTPTTARRVRAVPGANCSGGVPSRLLPSSSVVICATIGRSQRRGRPRSPRRSR